MQPKLSSAHGQSRRSYVVNGYVSTPMMPEASSKEYADHIRNKYGIAKPIGDDTHD